MGEHLGQPTPLVRRGARRHGVLLGLELLRPDGRAIGRGRVGHRVPHELAISAAPAAAIPAGVATGVVRVVTLVHRLGSCLPALFGAEVALRRATGPEGLGADLTLRRSDAGRMLSEEEANRQL